MRRVTLDEHCDCFSLQVLSGDTAVILPAKISIDTTLADG